MRWNSREEQVHDQWEQVNLSVAHIASAGAILGALGGWLPPIAAFIGALWYCLQIYETKTVQSALAKWRKSEVKEEKPPED